MSKYDPTRPVTRIMGTLLIHLTEIFGGIMFVSTNKDCHKDRHLLS